MSEQSYAEYQEEMRGRLLPKAPTNLDTRESYLWGRCVDLIREHLGRDETRWPERYQECGLVFGVLAKGLAPTPAAECPICKHEAHWDEDCAAEPCNCTGRAD